jgi:hypothetical protein
MKYRIIMQEERKDEASDDTLRASVYMQTTHEVASSDPVVIAATLRSIANQLDPVHPVTRKIGTEPLRIHES